MQDVEKVREITTNMVVSYDERIRAVEEIIEKSLMMLDQSRLAEQAIQIRLKATLARVESLRKKDFDGLTAPLLAHQERREGAIRMLLKTFLKKQRELAGRLKRMIQAGILAEVPQVETSIHDHIEQVKRHILAFQAEQTFIGEKMQGLLQKQEGLTLKEFKETLELLQAELGLNHSNGNPKLEIERKEVNNNESLTRNDQPGK